ncbi:MAG: ABC transporter substrate-binding protein [Acidobacteriota bacterium]
MSRRLVVLVALLLSLACQRDEKRAAGPASAKPVIDDGRPQDGGTVVRRLESDAVTLNAVSVATIVDRYIDNLLYTPMVYLDHDLQPIPGLAESWDVAEEGKVYHFELNKKATFSDGTPVLASDVLFTLRKILDPASEAVQVIDAYEDLDLTRTKVIDEHTIDIVFRNPRASRMLRFADLLVIPEHVYAKGNFRLDYNDVAVGSGPYLLVKRVPGKEIILERRKDYWAAPPSLERIIFKVIVDHGTAWNALKRGDIDESRIASDVWLRERNNPALNKYIDFRRFYTLNFNFITWNTRNPLLRDKRVRRALAMCIPIESVIQDLYHGTARAMSGPFTPDDFAFNPNVPPLRYDPEGARALLASAGWTDSNGDGALDQKGRSLKIQLMIMSGAATTAQFGQMVQAEMKRIGVDVELLTLDPAVALQRIISGNYEAAYLAFELDADPDPFGILHSSQWPPRGQNFSYYGNPEVDRLIDTARVELDRSKRRDLYWKIHEIVAADQPYTWTVQVSSKWAINRRVRGVEISRGYGLFRWYPGDLGWWIPQQLRTHDRPAQ